MEQIETENQSSYSPGPVLSAEQLLRFIFSPDHIDDSNELKPEGISREDLKTRGFSIQRREHVSNETIRQLIDAFVQRKEGRECHGIKSFLCDDVRDLKNNENNQAFVVIDDAKTEDETAHAIILFSEKSKTYSASKQRKLRKNLLDLIKSADYIDN